MTEARESKPRLPPRLVMRAFWSVHRGVFRVTGGRLGLWPPRADRWGTLRLTTTGRRTGREWSVILAYIEDGSDLVTLAMNGWGEGEPAWWLNLQAHPEARAELPDGLCRLRARAAEEPERARLWARWREVNPKLDAEAALRSTPTAVVILERV